MHNGGPPKFLNKEEICAVPSHFPPGGVMVVLSRISA